MPGAAKWFLNEVRQGILSDEDIAEIKNKPPDCLHGCVCEPAMLSRVLVGEGRCRSGACTVKREELEDSAFWGTCA